MIDINEIFQNKDSGAFLHGEGFNVTFKYGEHYLSVIVHIDKVDGLYPASIDVYKDSSDYFVAFNRERYREDTKKLKSGTLVASYCDLEAFLDKAIKSDKVESYRNYLSISDIHRIFDSSGVDVQRIMDKCKEYEDRHH